ncbi:ATP synthase F1 subcomplex epsilon subunit [Clostridium cavendishii DSM 21758]|uniref:ATP synthase epsilon chain n=1 Tax=Clostridium cavendishii DSM 21758 TaxID=1121302 RepID=A0A1M6U3H9_9CLOT|nr:ATP synthase F1 subunit epsilon [Clostridium cavendishii]SHK63691.1 ATP synthase F1 subcomplex epsilon subunit [Clostridium cavendishii DSM 21758]
MSIFKLTIITPEKEVYSGNAKKLKTVNSYGEFEILSNHADFITSTVPAITTLEDEKGDILTLFTSQGVLNFKDQQLTFCVDSAEHSEEIDVERAQKAMERSKERLSHNKDTDVKRAELALARAMTRLKYVQK